jgi:hypothetical protein
VGDQYGSIFEEAVALRIERDRLRKDNAELTAALATAQDENERLREAGRGSTIWASALDERDRYRDALRELVEGIERVWDPGRRFTALDRARALLKEVNRG